MWYLHINFSAKIWYEGDIHVTVWHSYHKQGRRSNQCHRAMARVDFFASKPRNIVYKPHFSDCQSKSLEASEGALVVFTRDRTYLSIVRTRTDPTFWPIFVRTYLPTPTYLLDILNISFIEKLPKIIIF